MMHDLLDDLAHDVPNYADPDRALAAARATRRRRAGAGVSVVTAALTLAALVTWVPPGRPGPDVSVPPLTPTAVVSAPTLPPLPDGAVGPAALMYRLACQPPCSREVIMLVDGTRYSVDQTADHGGPSLSPNGRLLAAPSGPVTYTVRDLGAATPPWPIEPALAPGRWEPSTWSSDNRWLLMWFPQGNGISNYARVDLAARTAVTYQPPADTHAIAVLASGELLLAPLTWAARQPLRLVDPATGAMRDLFTVDTASTLPTGHSISHDPATPAMVSADGSRLGVIMRAPGNKAGGLLEINLATGAVIAARELKSGADWTPVAYTADGGLYVVTRSPARAGVLDATTLTVTEIDGLPAPTSVLVPGGHTWYGR